jgi:anti-anti-sigma regulatory factor
MTLRIQTSAEGEQVVFTLAGRIQADQVADLQTLFESGLTANNIVLDLKEVKLVDRGAVRFLARHEAEGARLRNCPAYIRQWILQESNGSNQGRASRSEWQEGGPK